MTRVAEPWGAVKRTPSTVFVTSASVGSASEGTAPRMPSIAAKSAATSISSTLQGALLFHPTLGILIADQRVISQDTGGSGTGPLATAFTLQVAEPHLNGPGGDVPVIVHDTRSGKVEVICGQGPAPAGATLAHYLGLGLDLVPGTGLLAACVAAFTTTTTGGGGAGRSFCFRSAEREPFAEDSALALACFGFRIPGMTDETAGSVRQ